METRLAVAIDALYDALIAANLGVNVWDGPVLSGNSGDTIHLGYDADPEGDAQAAAVEQQWAGIGTPRKRNESLDITCAAVVLLGNSDSRWKAPRDRATALIDAVGQILRANPSLGQVPPCRAELMPGDYFQENGPNGYQARFVFTVHIETRV
jgi:hypothetical protein